MPTLYERKIIDLGRGSLVMTLPRAWLRYFHLKPGDRLLVIANGELIIRPPLNQLRRADGNDECNIKRPLE